MVLHVACHAQGVWDNPFESTLRTHHRSAWSFSGGTHMMMGMPSTVQSAWILNHGSEAEPVLDTLHLGIWRTSPQAGWRAGIGHLWLREDALWADRLSASVHVSQARGRESFLGDWKGSGADTSVAFVDSLVLTQASATFVELNLQTMRAVATGPDGFVEVRSGLRGVYTLSQAKPTVLPHFFTPAALPSWHVALSLGVGAGLKIYRGRMVRLTVDVDVLQLAQAPTDNLFRATDADVRGLNWMQSGYRPWRVTLHHDLYKRKPEEGCAAPTRSTASKTLFDPKMKGAGKAKNKGLKKALKGRGG